MNAVAWQMAKIKYVKFLCVFFPVSLIVRIFMFYTVPGTHLYLHDFCMPSHFHGITLFSRVRAWFGANLALAFLFHWLLLWRVYHFMCNAVLSFEWALLFVWLFLIIVLHILCATGVYTYSQISHTFFIAILSNMCSLFFIVNCSILWARITPAHQICVFTLNTLYWQSFQRFQANIIPSPMTFSGSGPLSVCSFFIYLIYKNISLWAYLFRKTLQCQFKNIAIWAYIFPLTFVHFPHYFVIQLRQK